MANEIDQNLSVAKEDLPEEEAPQEKKEETSDWEAQLKEQEAETAKYKRMAEQRAKKLDEFKNLSEEKPPENKPQSDEPDYAKMAFLESKSISHPDDQKEVLAEAERLKLPLTDILNMEHIQARLKVNGDTRTAKTGLPEGKGRTGQASQNDVDYYIENPDKVPEDLETHKKVIDAKMKKVENAGKFSDVPFIG